MDIPEDILVDSSAHWHHPQDFKKYPADVIGLGCTQPCVRFFQSPCVVVVCSLG